MDEGLFQLLFILFILFLAFADVLGRGRKRQRRREEMEREEGEGAPWEPEDPEEWGGFEPPGPEGGRTPTAEAEPTSGAGAEGSGTAADMIPSDIWEEMTGRTSEAGSRAEAPSPHPPSGERGPGAPPEPPRAPHEDVPRDFPEAPPTPHGEVPREFPGPTPSPHRDVPRDFPGPPPSPHERSSQRRGEQGAGAPVGREGRGSGGEGRGTGQEGRGARQEGRGPERGAEDGGTEVPHVPDERELRRRAMAEERGRAGAGRSRPRRGGVLGSELIPRGDPQAFRKAVVYREVLGPPVGFRPGGPGWESEAGGVLLSGGVGRPGKAERKDRED